MNEHLALTKEQIIARRAERLKKIQEQFWLLGAGKHRLSQTREYNSWNAMKRRCKSHPNYAGRGVSVCTDWQRNFLIFLADMGFKPSAKHEIDRIDNNGDYEPGNCRWATRSEQMKNIRKGAERKPRRFTGHGDGQRRICIFGKEHLLSEICKDLGLPQARVAARLDLGWSVERALNEPVHRVGRFYEKEDRTELPDGDMFRLTGHKSLRDRRVPRERVRR